MKNTEAYSPVRTHKAFLTYLMFQTVKKRTEQEGGWVYKKNLGGKSEAIASASETITGADIQCLIGIIKFIFDNKDLVVSSIMNFPPTKKYPTGRQETWLSITGSLNFFLTHYVNHKNKAILIQTLERLRTYQVAFSLYQKEGNNTVYSSFAEHYLKTCTMDGDEVVFTISEGLFQLIDTEGWNINFNRLSELSGIAQSLYMYLVQQGGTVFTQSFLEERLGLTEESKRNRDAIKQALTLLLTRKDCDLPEVKRIGYLQSFTVIKKGKGEYSFNIVKKVNR